MMLTHCGNNVRNRYSGCVFSVKDIVPVPLKTSRNHVLECNMMVFKAVESTRFGTRLPGYSDSLSPFDQNCPHSLPAQNSAEQSR